ncbi:MAG: HAMP domain-containing histidine kinase [Ignavibacteria bacterium]|nr:HAMP domain-containing histidine kinase [Ignavibacteria bacterium]
MILITVTALSSLLAAFAILFAVRERLRRRADNQIFRRRAEELADLHEQLRLAHLNLEEQHHEVRLANVEIQEHNAQLHTVSEERLMILGMVSHDLKNPLTAIQGLAEAMTMTELAPEDYKEYAAIILESSYRMNHLLRGFLDLSRIESGSVRLDAITLNVGDVVQALISQYRHAADKKLITIREQMQDGVDYSVVADESATQQVIENLLSNAVKYSPHGTTVTVRVSVNQNLSGGAVLFKEDLDRLDEITNQSQKSYTRIEVCDEGPGLSTDDKLKLFGKFSRLSARPTGGEDSTGLGLAIVKTLVEAMNGRVWCESELGKGATFIVELPSHL